MRLGYTLRTMLITWLIGLLPPVTLNLTGCYKSFAAQGVFHYSDCVDPIGVQINQVPLFIEHGKCNQTRAGLVLREDLRAAAYAGDVSRHIREALAHDADWREKQRNEKVG